MSLANFRYLISPFFIGKYYLQRDIVTAIGTYKFEGTVFDLGCGQKPYQALFTYSSKYVGIDFGEYSTNKDFGQNKPDYLFSSHYRDDSLLDIENESFDNAVAFQVLEHHPEPQIMIKEMVRITKKGGLLMVTVPFLGGLHEEPFDFQRFTKYQLSRLFQAQGCEMLCIKEQGALFSTILMLLSEHLNWFAAKNKFFYYASFIGYVPLLFCMYGAIIVDRFIPSDKIFINYLVVAKKNG